MLYVLGIELDTHGIISLCVSLPVFTKVDACGWKIRLSFSVGEGKIN